MSDPTATSTSTSAPAPPQPQAPLTNGAMPVPPSNDTIQPTASSSSSALPQATINGGNGGDIEMNGTSTPPTETKGDDDDDDEKKKKMAGEEEKEGVDEPDLTSIFQARREEELARRDRSLAEFLIMLDGYKPLIPEQVTEYYLQRAGFECSDPRLKRLLSLSAQKFISDLSRDAFHFAKLRLNGTAVGRGRPATITERSRVTLTMDDLSLALGEHGVNVNKPDYYL